MTKKIISSLFLAFIYINTMSCATPSSVSEEKEDKAPPAPVVVKETKKLLLITLVNAKYEEAIAQPYLSKLAKEGALLENYRGVTHPSQPNFLALVAGDTFKVTNNHNVNLDEKHIADLLEEKNKTWKVYAEDFPGNCAGNLMSNQYRKKLNPLIGFKNINSNPERCQNIVNAKAFKADLQSKTLPDFSMYIPDQLHNGHDSDVTEASKWLQTFLDPMLKNPEFTKDTLIIVLFDQDFYYTPKNHVYAVMLGKGIQPGVKITEQYNHYNMLRTIQDYFGLDTLNKKDATAEIISGVWKKETSNLNN